MKIIFLGPPGSGKGSYASRLSPIMEIPHISTGDLFRENMKNKTELGIEANKYIEKGDLVPDEITIRMLKERIERPDCKNGFFLDGFPRTIAQANALEKIAKIHKVLNFVATDETIIHRLGGRRICKKCGAIYHITELKSKIEGICDKCGGEPYQRKDDMPEVIKERLKVYEKQTKPLIDYYTEKKLIANINANPVFRDEGKIQILNECDEALKDLKVSATSE